jgi:hypothetical protein
MLGLPNIWGDDDISKSFCPAKAELIRRTPPKDHIILELMPMPKLLSILLNSF